MFNIIEVFIIINSEMHSHEAVLGVYSSWEAAWAADVWNDYGDSPDTEGKGDVLFIHKEIIQS